VLLSQIESLGKQISVTVKSGFMPAKLKLQKILSSIGFEWEQGQRKAWRILSPNNLTL
jgi:hypothetical protein